MTLQCLFSPRLARGLLLGGVLISLGAACAPSAERLSERQLAQARAAFTAGEYERARDLFLRFEPGASGAHEGAVGAARSEQQLGEYAAALTSYERALEQRPDDALAWEGYVATLHADGMRRDDSEQLARVLAVAPAALRAAPDSVEIYTDVMQSAAVLDRLGEYVPLLEDVAAALPDRDVPRIESLRARIDAARRARSDELEGLLSALRELVEDLTARTANRRAPEAGALYALAVGNDLLRRPGEVDAALQRLERSDAGRKMAMPMRHRQFLGEWVRHVDAPAAERVAIAERWLPRFVPRWEDNPAYYRDVLGKQFDVMVAAAEAQLEAAGGTVSEAEAERIADTGRRLARIDTDYGALRYVQTANLLSRLPSQLVTAVRVTDDGIEALRAERPGLLHPSTPPQQRDTLRRTHLAELLRLQARALRNLGRADEAEEALREAQRVEAEQPPGR